MPTSNETRVRVEDLDGNLLGVARRACDPRGQSVLQPDVVLTT